MNVVTGLCHSSKWKSRYLSESFVLNVRSAKPSKSRPDSQRSTEIRDSTCPRSTAKYYRSHVIAIVRPAVTQPCHRSSHYNQPVEVDVKSTKACRSSTKYSERYLLFHFYIQCDTLSLDRSLVMPLMLIHRCVLAKNVL